MERTLKSAAKDAKQRLKNGFWEDCKLHTEYEDVPLTQSRAKRLLCESQKKPTAKKDEDFYQRVKLLLSTEGEVSDAIGRLTDYDVYDRLTYDERQLYTLELSERYLKAVRRYYAEQKQSELPKK